MNPKTLLIATIGVLLLAACSSAAQAKNESNAASSYTDNLRGAAINPARPIPDFTFTAADGTPFTFSQQRGKVLLLYFGYMTCPDVCPTTLADLQRAYQALGAPDERVEVAFVTVDPERDTPERLAMFTNAFHADFIGLRGDPADLEPVLDAFGISVTRREVESALGYMLDHTASVFLVAPDGKLVAQFLYGTSYQDIAHDVQLVLDASD